MTQHSKTVEAIYAAFGRGDIPTILDALREDVEWEHDSVDHGIPWLTPREGRAEVSGFFEALRALDIRRFEPKRILADGNMVVAVIHVEIAVRASGRVINDVELHLWTFDTQGKVARFRHVPDKPCRRTPRRAFTGSGSFPPSVKPSS